MVFSQPTLCGQAWTLMKSEAPGVAALVLKLSLRIQQRNNSPHHAKREMGHGTRQLLCSFHDHSSLHCSD